MSGELLTIFVLYAAFVIYLLSAGVGLRRTGGVVWQVIKFGAGIGAVLAVFALLALPSAAATTFLVTVIIVSLIWLPIAAMSRARDFLMPRSTVLEVVCLNVLVIVIGEPQGGFPIFRQLLGIVQQALLNPFVIVIPEEHAWLNTVISLWPSLLALWLAAKGKGAGRWLRFFPMLWVQITAIVWLFPASVKTLVRADLSTAMGSLDLLVAALGLVHVVLTWVILRDALTMNRTTLPMEDSSDSTEKLGVARRLADGMSPGPWSPPAYVVAAVLTWFAIRASLSYLPTAGTLMYGFLGAFVAGALALRLEERQSSSSGRVPLWLASASALVISLVWLSQSDLLPGYWQKMNARYATVHSRGMTSPEPVAEASCKLVREEVWGLRCPDRFWSLGELQHPGGLQLPIDITPTPTRIWGVDWTGPRLQCHEYTARTADGDTKFLLLYLPGAWQGSQYLWSAEPEGECVGFRARTYPGDPQGSIRWEYRAKRFDSATSVGTVRPLEASSSGKEQGPEAEQGGETDAVGERSEDHAGR
jgi:hypothetical protein